MKLAIGQLNVKAGHPSLNLLTMKRMIDEAVDAQADLIIFPEMAVGGYILQDKWLDHDWLETLTQANDLIKSWSENIGIIWGNVITDPFGNANNNRDGRPFRANAALFAYQNRYVKRVNNLFDGLYVKHCLPDYRFFDDSRFFMSGVEIAALNRWKVSDLINPFMFSRNNETVKIGLEVCEDLWSKDYSIDPTSLYVKQKVDFIVNISSSPWTQRKEISRTRRIQEHVSEHGTEMVPIIYVNACGMQNTGKNVLMFDGDSTVYAKDGTALVECNDSFREELLFTDLKTQTETKPCENKLLTALMEGVRQFDDQLLGGKLPWIIGCSGGLDSSVNAALLVAALGKDRVIGYNMASQFNQLKTIQIAKNLADRLEIRYREGSIEEVVDATLSTMQAYGYQNADQGLVHENVQARMRGHLLSTFAALEGGVICNNGNKIELALGYCTLYGDSIGALSPLGDCTKVQLFDLARQLNQYFGHEVISEELLPQVLPNTLEWEVAPSAELKDNQLDPMKWFYHDWLIQTLIEYPTHGPMYVMNLYLNEQWKLLPVARWITYYHLDDPKNFIDDLEWVITNWQKAVFKRIQYPPLITVSRGSFGSDYRESQIRWERTADYEKLKQRILAKKTSI